MDTLALRALLFTPANRVERFAKAQEVGADGIVIDLEDAIALAQKDAARETMVDYFKTSKPLGKCLRCLRINSIKTVAGLKDLAALAENNIKPDALIIPKVESAAEIQILDHILGMQKIPYFVVVETALGLSQADSIATSSPQVKAICFGGADLAADLGTQLAWETMLSARFRVVQAAALAGIVPLDVPYLKIHQKDSHELEEETQKAKALGYVGKFAIHPEQIQPILNVFKPSAEEIEKAKKIVTVYEQAKGNVCEIDGKMIDVPVFRSAKRILALAAK